jgi:hypothetical protein
MADTLTECYADIHTLSDSFVLGSYKVLYDYDAQRNDELSLKVGDIVHIIQHDSDEWCIAENTETGQQGAVPTNVSHSKVNQKTVLTYTLTKPFASCHTCTL